MISGTDLVLVPAWAVRDRNAIVRWIRRTPEPGRPDQLLRGCHGTIVLDRSECTVTVDGALANLRPTGFLFLESLLEFQGETQAAQRLGEILWGEAANLRSSSLRAVASGVRRALRRHALHVRCVRTVGYRWVEHCDLAPDRDI